MREPVRGFVETKGRFLSCRQTEALKTELNKREHVRNKLAKVEVSGACFTYTKN